jgi:hypothetical protein
MQEGEGGGELRSGPPSGKPAGVRPSRLARASVVATRPSGAYFLKKNRRGRGLGGADVADSRGSSLSFRLPSSMFVCKAQVWH